MHDRWSRNILALLLCGIGIALSVSCVVAAVSVEPRSFLMALLEAPGALLFRSFHLASFFVPLYFLLVAGFVAAQRITSARLITWTAGAVPMSFAGLALRLTWDPDVLDAAVPGFAAALVTRPGAAVLSAALFLLSLAALRRLSRRLSTAAAASAEGEQPHRAEERGSSRPLSLPPARGAAGEESGDASEDDAADARHEAIGLRGAPALRDKGTQRLRALADEHAARNGRGASDEGADELEPAAEDSDAAEDSAAGEEAPLSIFFSRGRFSDDDPRRENEEAEWQSGSWEAPYAEAEDYEHYEDDDDAPRRGSRAVVSSYSVPIRELLDSYGSSGYWEIDEETKEAAEVLRVTLEEFQIQAEVTGIRKGPVITMFEILPAPGVKLAKIVNLADNIALRLAAQSVRIVAPIPGKHAVGIEIPNRHRHIVSFAELLEQEDFSSSKQEIPLALGKDIPGDAQIVDLTKTPHLLIAGATGSGKSVCVNSIICSVLFRRRPDEVKMILIDPKIVELKFYNDIPHLLTPVITDPKRAFQALQYLIYEMERRYTLLDSQGVRDIKSYNNKIKRRKLATEPLPYIVVVVDEFADLISTSGKELESTLARLAAMSRAVGIHLVLATQRPSTDVITGLIKANIPSRIAFMVSSKVDSRIIIDTGGAEKLLGQGDMLFTSAWDPFPFRMQGAFLSEEEVDRVVTHVKSLGEPEYIDDEIFIDDDEDDPYQQELEDPLLEKAIDIVTTANKASASYLQRRLKIGYNRAARMVEEMERIGIVGPQRGSKPRDIIGAGEQV